jgi:excisionase family DNA binding protein
MSEIIIEPLLTARDVATMLALSTHSVLDMAQDGRLSSLKLGHAVRFKRSDIEAYIEASYRHAKTTPDFDVEQ